MHIYGIMGKCATVSIQTHNLKIFLVQPIRRTCFIKLFILAKRSTCFGRFFRPSSGAQNCAYSNDICQTPVATCCYRGRDGTPFRPVL